MARVRGAGGEGAPATPAPGRHRHSGEGRNPVGADLDTGLRRYDDPMQRINDFGEYG
ncbi:hypothetical protein [Microbulbifer halophilus]|uniref:hypothetical protein n=1 Tax=Microbulbifer halophilus TaxID=453963 RepID=UPI00360D3335